MEAGADTRLITPSLDPPMSVGPGTGPRLLRRAVRLIAEAPVEDSQGYLGRR